MIENDNSKIKIYLDNNLEPYATYSPPAKFDLDTSKLEDGEHLLKVVALDSSGRKGIRIIPFIVRNGPGIAVQGLNSNDIVEGNISLLVNAYGASKEDVWYPHKAETPAPVPTWAWIIFILIVAWGLYYASIEWEPGAEFANTPTFAPMSSIEKVPEIIEESSNLGASLYRTSCASCHQSNGQGIPGAFPPLAKDPIVIANDPTEHIKIVLFGANGAIINGIKYEGQMPAWENQLSDEEAAAVINHERTSWVNNAPTVTPDQVNKIRNSKTTLK